jgi:hypothetical protein
MTIFIFRALPQKPAYIFLDPAMGYVIRFIWSVSPAPAQHSLGAIRIRLLPAE